MLNRKKDKPKKFKSFQELRSLQSEERLSQPSNLTPQSKPGTEPKGITTRRERIQSPKIDESGDFNR